MQPSPPRPFSKQQLSFLIQDLKTTYIEFLKCLKLQNRKDRIKQQKQQRRNRKIIIEDLEDGDYEEEEISLSFNEEMGKENRMETTFMKLAYGINKLVEFNGRMKEWIVLEVEERRDGKDEEVVGYLEKMLGLK